MPGPKEIPRGRIGKPHENQVLLDTAMQEAGIDSTYELASRAGVAPSVLYKFRKGVTTRFYGTTELKLAAILPNLFGKRTYSASEMRVKSAPLREQFAKTVAKVAAKATKSASAKQAAGGKATKKKSQATAVAAKTVGRKKTPAAVTRAKKVTKPTTASKKKAKR